MKKTDKENNFFSTLAGIDLLLFSIAFFLHQTVLRLPIVIGSFSILISIRTMDMLTIAAAVLTAIGVFSAIRDVYPEINHRECLIHTILPFSTIITIGILLRNTTGGAAWWLLLFSGGLILYLVFVMELTICDENDPNNPLASIFLTALCYAAFFIAAVAIRANIIRLLLTMPMMGLVVFLVTLRVNSLQHFFQNGTIAALLTAFIMIQPTAALHYLPLNSISYGFFMFLCYYILNTLMAQLLQGIRFKTIISRQMPVVILISAGFVYSAFFLNK